MLGGELQKLYPFSNMDSHMTKLHPPVSQSEVVGTLLKTEVQSVS